MTYPVIELSNGLRVGNFSSPHPFTFTDGSVLPACDNETATHGMLDATETPVIVYDKRSRNHVTKYQTIEIAFKLNSDVNKMIQWWIKLYEDELVDVVIVPLPVMTAIHRSMDGMGDWVITRPFRTIRVANRITKEIYIDKFCI